MQLLVGEKAATVVKDGVAKEHSVKRARANWQLLEQVKWLKRSDIFAAGELIFIGGDVDWWLRRLIGCPMFVLVPSLMTGISEALSRKQWKPAG